LPEATIAVETDAELKEYLREWRRTTAKEKGVAAFVVLHDTSLDELCQKQPTSLGELRGVFGFGQRKIELYGRAVLQALQRFRAGARATAVKETMPRPAEETLRLLAEGRSFEEIAQIRGRRVATVISLVASLVEKGEVEFQPAWVDQDRAAMIRTACERLGTEWLKPVKDALPPEITYDEIRLMVAHLKRHDTAKLADAN
jgi:ATP-dependent DNA helicase RecQ